jgi:hypothetical protein
VALQGTLDTFALPDVLRLLAATKKSGQLQITGQRGAGDVWAWNGEIVGIQATHAPHATDPVDGLFELLRFEEGSFTFDAEATPDDPSDPIDLEGLLSRAESLLEEWHAIEAVVPSLDAWVSLRPSLPTPQVTVDQTRWTTLVAVGGGTTVGRLADALGLAELPISRSVKELVELGLVEVAASAPDVVVPHPTVTTTEGVVRSRPLLAGDEAASTPPTASGARTRRARARASAPIEPEVFVPLDLPGHGAPASYDEPQVDEESLDEDGDLVVTESLEVDLPAVVDDLAAAFPGLANRSAPSTVDVDDEELAKQLATLSPRAATAIRAAAEAATDEERDAALDEAEGDDQTLNRGLLLKFLSSVKS